VTPRGSLDVTWGGHSTALVELDGVRVLTDPVLRNRVGPLRRIAAPVSSRIAERIDAVLLSHLHLDHADLPSLRGFGASTIVIAPRGSARWLSRRGVRGVEELGAGEQADVGNLRIVATPARHDGRRRPLGVHADPVGFIVQGTQALYFAGDTDVFDEMSAFSGSVDLALLPIAGWGPRVGPGHLDPVRATHAAARIAPRVVVPIHWGTLALGWPAGRAGDPEEPARRFAVLMARDVPRVEVRVLAAGERTCLSPRGPNVQGRPALPA
jgi:L-ascorbate metabolism protein UlaG (beta-lactamase superfamily)